MQLIVYADESGIHDPTGKLLGSKAPVIAGFVDTVENWKELCLQWQQVLDSPKYRAPFFHFRETRFSERKKPKNPYRGWDDEKVDDFIHDLAILTSRTAVPVGGHAYAGRYRGDPIKRALEKFFDEFTDIVDTHWPHFNEPVSFFFDQQKDNKAWIAMLDGVFKRYQKKDARLHEYTFKCSKCGPGCQALQAADMIAFATRQTAEKYYTDSAARATIQPRRVLDHILFKNLRGVAHPMYAYSMASTSQEMFEKLITLWRQHQKERKSEWAAQGLKNKIYYPEKEFPFEQHGYETDRPNTA